MNTIITTMTKGLQEHQRLRDREGIVEGDRRHAGFGCQVGQLRREGQFEENLNMIQQDINQPYNK